MIFVIPNLLYNEIRCLTKNDIFFCGLGFEIEKTNYRCEYFVGPAQAIAHYQQLGYTVQACMHMS